MTVGKVLWVILKVMCYGALAFVVVGFISLVAPSMLGLCDEPVGTTIKCSDPLYRSIFEFGFTVVMLTVFTGLPGLLALGGVGFLIRDVFWRRRA